MRAPTQHLGLVDDDDILGDSIVRNRKPSQCIELEAAELLGYLKSVAQWKSKSREASVQLSSSFACMLVLRCLRGMARGRMASAVLGGADNLALLAPSPGAFFLPPGAFFLRCISAPLRAVKASLRAGRGSARRGRLVDALGLLGEMPDAIVSLALDLAVDLLVRVRGGHARCVREHRRA
jgi:hypothetical protein